MQPPSPTPPTTRNLAPLRAVSLAVAALMAVASLVGLLFGPWLYPTAELLQTAMPNDLVNLVLGVPIMLGTMALARRGRLIGLLFWPGAHLYVFYNYLVNALAVPLNVLSLGCTVPVLALALVLLSAYGAMGLVRAIDADAVAQRLRGAIPARLAGGVLVGFGVAFLGLALDIVYRALRGSAPVARNELALAASDAVASVIWIVSGVALWRRTALGYVVGPGALFHGAVLFLGLILFMLLQPLLTIAPFLPGDFLAIVVMALVCLAAFYLLMRGLVSADRRR